METKPWETSEHREISVHDPSIYSFIDDSGEETFYVFGTHIAQAKSHDLVTWEVPNETEYENMEDNLIFGNTAENLAETFEWSGHDDADSAGGFNLWAPDIIWNPDFKWANGDTGAFQMYYSASSTWRRSSIATLVAPHIEGPYTYVDTIIYSGFSQEDGRDGSDRNINYHGTNIAELIDQGIVEEFNPKWTKTLGREYNTDYAPNAIDPTVFLDENEDLWLVYGSWSGGIYLLPLNPDTGTPIYPGTDGETADGRIIDRYFGTKLSGGHHQSGEGPYIHYNADTGYYYLWVTYGGLNRDGGYNMRLFRSENVDGSYLDFNGNDGIIDWGDVNDSFGIKLMGNYIIDGLKGIGYKAPGHNSVLVDSNNNWFNVFHVRFNTNNEMHRLRVHQMYYTDSGWPITLPYRYSGVLVEPIEQASNEVAGTYQWVDHGNTTTGDMIVNQKIILSEDGQITGDYSGNYELTADGQIQLIIEDEPFDGVIVKQVDEFEQPRIVIAAIGQNNQTVWGIQLKNE
ncbi:glycoside hydrolase family 43 protein [Fundicoccus culcitae]|uniref:Glycoside hydrolase family 43 protein n=1 Tax=Fundicoccus culcitae TaxID=2969821 RepID=A0ABY5P9G1_9LACT|nr:glycoside hydrolase family 43 protein [Fundicoccus culcitae]UUX35387.1 glycoside hydrolase family 43 protein [Fundicoccus culcitae]